MATNDTPCIPTKCTLTEPVLLSRAVGAGLPASPDSSSPLPHAHLPDGGSPVLLSAETQTLITICPSRSFVTFSAKTCAELLPHLSDEQLDFEIRFNALMGRNINYTIDDDIDVDFNNVRDASRVTKIDALGKSVSTLVSNEFAEIFYDCESFSTVTHEISRAITDAKKFIDEVRTRHETEKEETDEIFYDCTSNDFDLPPPVCFLEFNVGEGLQVSDFTHDIEFKKIGNRKVAHFGTQEYRYGGITHPPRDYPTCVALDSVCSRLQASIPDFNRSEWGCLITHYDSGKSYIPPHSDDEDSILPDSNIITVSVGATRTLIFQNIIGPILEQQKFDLQHGSVYKMSQGSQKFWEHSIPPSPSPECGPRISLTFRKLRTPNRPKVPPIAQPQKDVPVEPPRPKRLLMLSDSIHLNFPTHLFDKKSVVCIKKKLPNFCLSDIHLYEDEFKYTDYVFISCGVNDLSRYGWNAPKLIKYFKDLMNIYSTRYPRTRFIFNSLLSTDFEWLNVEISHVNREIFMFSLGINSNVWFFDSHHVAVSLSRRGVQVLEKGTRRANGVHLTYRTSDEIRHVIKNCVTDCCNGNFDSLRSIWPLRPEFRAISVGN